MQISAQEYTSQQGWAGRSWLLTPGRQDLAAQQLAIEVAEPYGHWISPRNEAAVLAALFPAMFLGEDIHLEGALSARFHYQLRQVMKFFDLWYEDLTMVNIHASHYDHAGPAGTHTLACFSGGVDSFYTLLHHGDDAEPLPGYRMSHGLFVHGFDIPLAETGQYPHLAQRYEQVLEAHAIGLVRARTNVREILDPHVKWMTTHGVALNMMAHFLAGGAGRFIIPSTNRFSLLNPPIGSNPVTDPQPGTEALELIHHGCEASRIEKVLAIAGMPMVHEHLRVCFRDRQNCGNCGQCRKCKKVMMPLWLTGKLDKFSCFPPGFDPSDLPADWFQPWEPRGYAPELTYLEELRHLAEQYNTGALPFLQNPAARDPAPPGLDLLSRIRAAFKRS